MSLARLKPRTTCFYNLKFLAVGAKVAAAVSDRDTLDRCAAVGAWLVFSVGYAEAEVGGSILAAGAFIGVYAGALIADSLYQDVLDSLM